jgi:hypothetical protein
VKWQEFIERYRDNLSPEEREKKWAEKAAMLRDNEVPLVAALTAKGWPAAVRQCGDTRSVWDLVNTAEPYPHLLGVLTAHLAKPYHRRTREGIVRALAVREARGPEIQRVLMDELMAETDPNAGPNSYRWALINTLVLIADSSLAADVQRLLADSRYESVRNDLERLAKKLKPPSRRSAKGK